MLRAVLRDLRAHPGRVAMTLVAIVLGVAFVVATWVVSDSAAESVANGATRSDFAVVVTGSLSAEDLDRLAAASGVTGATGVLIGETKLVQSNGKLSERGYLAEGGTNWTDTQRFNLVSGRAPAAGGEVALEEKAAADAGYSVGSTARLLASSGEPSAGEMEAVTVVGLFTYRTASPHEPWPVVAFDTATAQERLGDNYSWVELFGADQSAIAAQASALGFDDVKTATQLTAERQEEAGATANAVRNFLLAFAGVALMVGMFVIANTFTMLVAQRTRHFALLRAVGAKRRQVRRAVLAEAAVIGLIGSTIGAALGVGLGWAGLTLLRNTGETVIFTVSPMAIISGYLVGVVVTVIAAYGSARRGANVAPVAALGTDYALPRRSLVVRTVLGLLALGGGVTAVLLTSGEKLTDPERMAGMGGALLGWFGVLLLAPLLASAVLLPLSRLVGRHGSVVWRLAVRNAIRDPRRTAATASALMIGLALVTAFATVGESVADTMTRQIKADVPAGTLVVQGPQQWMPVPSDVVGKVEGTAIYRGYTDRRGLTLVEGSGKELNLPVPESGVLVPKESELRVGETVTLAGVSLKVTGSYDGSFVYQGIVVRKSALPSFEDFHLEGVYVSGTGRAALDAAFADRPDVFVRDRDEMIAQFTEPMRLALAIIYGLLGAAVLIAVFGVVNTLALSVLERTREIGVFRAVGATRGLVRRSVRRESVVIAAYGGLLGVGVGVLLGGVMQHVIMSTPILSLTVPLPIVAGALAGMVLVGVLAALWPARRASRTDILGAIATS